MNDLDELARELRAQRPPIPAELLEAQRQRLLCDPRARVAGRGLLASGRARLGVAFALALAALALWLRTRPADAPARLARDASGATEQRLEDGTLIRLEQQARGALADDGPRDVRFDLERGKAEFDVTPNPERTFRVLAGAAEVRVLGTRFSVDYDPAGKLRVAVERGVVAVLTADAKPVRLEAGERLEVDTARPSGAAPPLSEPPLPATPAAALEPDAGAPELEEQAEAHSDSDIQPHYRRALAANDLATALREARRRGLDRVALELGPAELAALAEAARLGNDPAAALTLLRALDTRFPRAEPAANASFLIGRLLARSGQRADAIAAFERYLGQHPNGPHANDALGRLMEAHADAGDLARAQAAAERYLQREPDGPYRRLAQSLIATPHR